ncbi:MAG: glycosyltransferase family 4 protein [Acidimicrobiales bacterium]
MSERSGRIGLVPPRFGREVIGGAEAVVADIGRGLAKRGWDVEILTTCARDHFTWANEYPEGVSSVDGMTVRRFPTQTDTDGRHRQHIGNAILSGERVSLVDQQLWINDSLRVSGLWHHVAVHRADYRALVFAPYMFWTTFAVGQIAPEKTILMPCLHDEPPARQEIFAPLFGGARGLWFLTRPEQELAEQLFTLPRRRAEIGAGVAVPEHYDVDGFRSSHGLERDFFYYAGRREWGKGWTDLLATFEHYVGAGGQLDLVTSGVGDTGHPAHLAGRVHDVGLLSEDGRNAAMAGARAYVQPSALESFSLTVLEAWLAGTPVIANAASDVVSWHVERSGAGVRYRSLDELLGFLEVLGSDAQLAGDLARTGRAYVLAHYRWEDVLDRVEQTLFEWTGAPS